MSEAEDVQDVDDAPVRGRGGAHTNARYFTGAEDRAIKRIVAHQEERRWVNVVEALVALGYERRTSKSVRNRFLRMHMNAQGLGKEAKNFCRVCRQFKKGHTCAGPIQKANDQ